MLNPITLAERAIGIGARVAGGALDIGRRAVGAVSGTSTGDSQPDVTAPEPQRDAPEPKPDITDTALARKVESELFRDADAPKGTVDVNAVGRVVYLRGEAKTPELINELEARAAAVPEVQRVENLLHLPKTPSPTRSDTPARQRKEKTTKGKPPRSHRRRVNAEKPAEGAEPAPKEVAKEKGGRKPARLGSTDPDEGGSEGEA